MNLVIQWWRVRCWWLVTAAVLACVSAPACAARKLLAEGAWIKGAAELVAMAKSHSSEAGFQLEVEQSRQRLREIVLQAGPHPAPKREQLFISMIMLNALLESATKCHQGGLVVCSANLIWQLDAQVRAASAQLKALGS
ncbi:MAG: hypothetical protein ACYDE0_07910 [Acidiferrobacterales bacterium]